MGFRIVKKMAGGGGGGGIASINGDSTSAQTIAAGAGIGIATAGGTTTITNTAGSALDPTVGPILLFDDFDRHYILNGSTTDTQGPMSISFQGSLTAADLPGTSELTRKGIMSFGCSSTFGSGGFFADSNSILLGNSAVSYATAVQLAQVPVGNNFDLIVGLAGLTYPGVSNGVVLAASTSVNATNWVGLCYKGGSVSILNTGIPFTTSWTNLRIEINTAGTSATFYVNGVSGGSLSTNIPNASGQNIGPFMRTLYNSGTGPFTTRVDWVYHKWTPGSARGTF